jgi:hypothetical protein
VFPYTDSGRRPRHAQRLTTFDGVDVTDRTPLDGLPDGWGFDWWRWSRRP